MSAALDMALPPPSSPEGGDEPKPKRKLTPWIWDEWEPIEVSRNAMATQAAIRNVDPAYLEPFEMLLLSNMAGRIGRTGQCWMTYEQIADDTKMSVRQAIDLVHRLHQRRLMHRQTRPDPTGRHPNGANVYRVDAGAIKQLPRLANRRLPDDALPPESSPEQPPARCTPCPPQGARCAPCHRARRAPSKTLNPKNSEKLRERGEQNGAVASASATTTSPSLGMDSSTEPPPGREATDEASAAPGREAIDEAPTASTHEATDEASAAPGHEATDEVIAMESDAARGRAANETISVERAFLAEFTRRYEATYGLPRVALKDDIKHAIDLVKAAEAQAVAHAGAHDRAQATALTEACVEHWLTRYFADRGNRREHASGYLVHHHHPLHCMIRGVQGYGVPWSKPAAASAPSSAEPLRAGPLRVEPRRAAPPRVASGSDRARACLEANPGAHLYAALDPYAARGATAQHPRPGQDADPAASADKSPSRPAVAAAPSRSRPVALAANPPPAAWVANPPIAAPVTRMAPGALPMALGAILAPTLGVAPAADDAPTPPAAPATPAASDRWGVRQQREAEAVRARQAAEMAERDRRLSAYLSTEDLTALDAIDAVAENARTLEQRRRRQLLLLRAGEAEYQAQQAARGAPPR